MITDTRLKTNHTRGNSATNAKEEKQAPWWGYSALSETRWYPDTPRNGEIAMDSLPFLSTTIDNNSGVTSDLLGGFTQRGSGLVPIRVPLKFFHCRSCCEIR